MLEFRVLGPLEVRRNGRIVDVRGSKRRAVLALLVLQANEIIRSDRLIDSLWGEDQPAHSSAALQTHISRLRKDLGEDVVVTKPWGYVLRTPPESIDLRRFEHLVATARPLAARERERRLATALSLWRGAALADLAHESAMALDAARLDQLRQSVIEQRIDAQLELGEHDEAIRVLEGLIAAHPLRERLRGQLILALYRAGRQAEALETYRETRRVLVDELGLEPSPELRELERAILRQDPSLAPTAVSPAQPPKDPPLPTSRWRWPRSPLLVGAALLVVLAGAGLAILATPRSGTPHAVAARGPVSAEAGKEEGSKSRAKAVIVARKNKKRLKRSPGESNRNRIPPAGDVSSPTGATKRAKPPNQTTTAQVTRAEPPPEKTKPPPPPPPPPPQPPPQVLIADNFDDGIRNESIWHQVATGTGIELAERNQRLEIGFAADGVPGGEYNTLGAHYGSQCRFPGDFDVRVDYELLDWPGANGVFIQLNAWFSKPPHLAVVRQSQTWGEGYSSFFGGQTSNRPTTDTNGSLRIKRVGTRFTTYYKSGGKWLRLDSVFSEGAPMISIQAMSMPEWFGHKAVLVALDNFSMRAVRPAC